MSVQGTDYDAIAALHHGDDDDSSDESYDTDDELAANQPNFAGAGPPVEEVQVPVVEEPEVQPPPAKKPRQERRTHSIAHEFY